MGQKMNRTARATLMLGVIAALGLSACETGPADDTSAANLVWPEAPEQPRITYLKSWSTNEFALDQSAVLNALLGEADEVIGLQKPYGVHADKSGRVFVTDTQRGKVIVYDGEKKLFDIWGQDGEGALFSRSGSAPTMMAIFT